jgi:hypothetical protein
MRTTKETVTVNYLGFNFDLTGNYTPEESMVMYYKDGSGYPGSSAEFEITEITLCGIDAEELTNRLDAWDELAELAIEQITN